MLKLREIFRNLFGNPHEGVFRRIPLNCNGAIFTSPMPSGAYDRGSRLLKIYQQNKIDHVVMLVTDEELEKKARTDLFQAYENAAIGYSQYAFKDFAAPSLDVLEKLVAEAIRRLQDQRVSIHCHAGVGRTAVAVSCIVMAIEKLTADQAVDYVASHMTVKITAEQKNLIRKFSPKPAKQ